MSYEPSYVVLCRSLIVGRDIGQTTLACSVIYPQLYCKLWCKINDRQVPFFTNLIPLGLFLIDCIYQLWRFEAKFKKINQLFLVKKAENAYCKKSFVLCSVFQFGTWMNSCLILDIFIILILSGTTRYAIEINAWLWGQTVHTSI